MTTNKTVSPATKEIRPLADHEINYVAGAATASLARARGGSLGELKEILVRLVSDLEGKGRRIKALD